MKCVCWICNGEGHYANECPTKKEKDLKEKSKLIKKVYKIYNLEPLEDELSDTDCSVYEYIEDESSSEETYLF
jgi:hypothetical protein